MSLSANTRKLASRALFITGSSRGIGMTNVVVAATAKLPVSTYTGSKEENAYNFLRDEFLYGHNMAIAAQLVRRYHTSARLFKEEKGDASGVQIPQLFDSISKTLSSDIVQKTQSVYQFNLKGKEEGTWYLDLKNGDGSCGQGEPKTAPDATLTMDSKNFTEMFAGKLKPATAFMMGKLKIKGDMQKAMKLEKMMKSLKA